MLTLFVSFLRVYCLVQCVLANDDDQKHQIDVWPRVAKEHGHMHLKWNSDQFERDFLLEPNKGHYIQIAQDQFLYQRHRFQSRHWLLQHKGVAKEKSIWFSDEEMQQKLDARREYFFADSTTTVLVHGQGSADVRTERIIVVAPYPLLVRDHVHNELHMKWTSLRGKEDFVFSDGSFIQFGKGENSNPLEYDETTSQWIDLHVEPHKFFGVKTMQQELAKKFSSDLQKNWYTPRFGDRLVLFVFASNENKNQRREKTRVVVKPLSNDALEAAAYIDESNDLEYDDYVRDEELEELLNLAFIAGYKKGFHHQ